MQHGPISHHKWKLDPRYLVMIIFIPFHTIRDPHLAQVIDIQTPSLQIQTLCVCGRVKSHAQMQQVCTHIVRIAHVSKERAIEPHPHKNTHEFGG